MYAVRCTAADLQTNFNATQNAPENRISRISGTPIALPIKIAFAHYLFYSSWNVVELHRSFSGTVEMRSVHNFKRLNFHTQA